MIVVDSSCISKFILKESGWEKISDFLANSITVDLALKEVANSILKAYRGKEITLDDVHIKFKALQMLIGKNVLLENQNGLIRDALEIALASNKLTIYDALFIILAKKKGMPLATCDHSQYEEAVKIGAPASLYNGDPTGEKVSVIHGR